MHANTTVTAWSSRRFTTPANRYGEEREIAEAIFFLASPKASFINGQILSVDGGFESTGIGLPDLRENQGNT